MLKKIEDSLRICDSEPLFGTNSGDPIYKSGSWSTSRTNYVLKRASTSTTLGGNTKTNPKEMTCSSKKKAKVAAIDQKTRIFSGGIQQILQASRANPNADRIIYETVAKIVSIKPGRFHCEKMILLRQGTGPIIQGIFNEIDVPLSRECKPNQKVRCIGRFINQSRFNIIKIAPTDDAFMETITRLNTISNFAIQK